VFCFFAAVNAEGVEGTPDDVVTNTGQVADTAASDEDDAVFLEVVALAADVGGDFFAVGEPHAGDFPHGRVGLFGCRGADLEADAAFLRGGVEVADLGLGLGRLAGVSDQLV